MNKLLSLIFVIIFLAYVPLGPVNYSSELSGIFVFLGELQTLLSGIINLIILNTSSFLILALDSVMPFLILIYETILSLPFSQINFWYVLLILIIISFFSEKFRTINNELNKLRKILLNSRERDKSRNNKDSIEKINNLNIKAQQILELLNVISTAAENFKNSNTRTKKIRRVNAENINEMSKIQNTSLAKDEEQLMRLRKDNTLQENQTEVVTNQNDSGVKDKNLAKDEEQLMRLRKDNTLQENQVEVVTNQKDDGVKDKNLAKDEEQLMRLRKDNILQENDTDEIMSDENISQIDLARAVGESNEKDDAIKKKKKIIDTGTEEEQHEAKLLYMQVK